MFYGMPTLIEIDTLPECASLCRELGLDFIEFSMSLPQYQTDKIDIAFFKEIAEKYKIFYTIHLDENLNISDFNPYIAEGYLRTVRKTVELAEALGTPVVNMHLSRGVYFTLPEKKVYLFEQYKEQYLKSISEFRAMCEEAVGDAEITICIENTGGFTDFQKEALEILLVSRVFGLTFDIGHDHCTGGADGQYILENKSRLRHMHLHDALFSARKDHLALGTGEINIDRCLSLAEEQNCLVLLETKTVAGLRQSVNWMRSRGKLRQEL